MSTVILPANASLKGRDLTSIYNLAKSHSDPEPFAMFKKKEPLDNMAKSLLKHRIQGLTGKAATDIEEEMGFPSTRDGGGVPVEVLRRLAHFLILEACGKLEAPPAPEPVEASEQLRRKIARRAEPEPEPMDVTQSLDETTSGAKRGRASRKSMGPNTPQLAATPTQNKRGSRRSMMPELLRDSTPSTSTSMNVTENVACRLTSSKINTTVQIIEEKPAALEVADEDLGLGSNPTPAMIAQKRRSMAMKLPSTPVKKTAPPKAVPTPAAPVQAETQSAEPEVASPGRRQSRSALPVVPAAAKKSPAASKSGKGKAAAPNLAAPRAGFPGSKDSEIFLAQGDPKALTYDDCLKLAPGFTGANLTIVHTPVEWEPMDVFNLTKSVRKINTQANLDCFLVMFGCGVSNVNLIRDALYTQTKHVQFIVLDRADQNLTGHKDGANLRDVTSFFLLAYFFPDCDKEDAVPSVPMVRPGYTNCFHTDNAEDLENVIVFVLTEEGDWILDLCCKKRGICLAAQRKGRNALAIDPDAEMLFGTKEKAAVFAKEQTNDFRKNVDGMIQNF